jgi:hypothetical protein
MGETNYGFKSCASWRKVSTKVLSTARCNINNPKKDASFEYTEYVNMTLLNTGLAALQKSLDMFRNIYYLLTTQFVIPS